MLYTLISEHEERKIDEMLEKEFRRVILRLLRDTREHR